MPIIDNSNGSQFKDWPGEHTELKELWEEINKLLHQLRGSISNEIEKK